VNAAERARGRHIAALLAGAWRDPSPPLEPRQHDPALWPLTVASGGGGLLWRRIRAAGLTGDAVDGVRAAYRQQVIDDALRARELEQACTALRAIDVTPILIKGWSVARHYPEPGLRPSIDVDLVVAPAQLAAARDAVTRARCVVDLHGEVPHLGGRDPRQVRERMHRARAGGSEVWLLSDEDQLRLLSLHLLTHGARRAIWLCDVALLVERAGATLDWSYILAGDRRAAEAVAAALGLARDVLGARIDAPVGTPPGWLAASLYEQWGRGFASYDKLLRLPASPWALVAEARRRWPNPIQATAALGAAFDDRPRLPLQVADYLLRLARYVRGGAS
jgi:hypothetical protein